MFGLFDWLGQSSDPTKAGDQSAIRSLAMQLSQGSSRESIGLMGSAASSDLAAQFAGRGMGSSGAAAAAQGGLYGELLAKLQQDQTARTMGAANLFGGIGETPRTNGGQLGSTLGNLLPLILGLVL